MQLNKFIEGLSILAQYYDKSDGYHLGADHDIIYIYPTDGPVPTVDLARLSDLGFFQPEVECGEEGSWSPEYYDPSEGWAAYV